jgi:hypothetical protein
VIDEAIKLDMPGMEIGTQHKYGLDILLDFKFKDSPMRPDTAEAFKKRPANPVPQSPESARRRPEGCHWPSRSILRRAAASPHI